MKLYRVSNPRIHEDNSVYVKAENAWGAVEVGVYELKRISGETCLHYQVDELCDTDTILVATS